MSRSLNKCLIPVLVLSLLLVPFLFDRFYIQFISKILVMIIFASSLNLLVGYTGLVSLGHAAFFGFSGYVLVCYRIQMVRQIFFFPSQSVSSRQGVLV